MASMLPPVFPSIAYLLQELPTSQDFKKTRDLLSGDKEPLWSVTDGADFPLISEQARSILLYLALGPRVSSVLVLEHSSLITSAACHAHTNEVWGKVWIFLFWHTHRNEVLPGLKWMERARHWKTCVLRNESCICSELHSMKPHSRLSEGIDLEHFLTRWMEQTFSKQ